MLGLLSIVYVHGMSFSNKQPSTIMICVFILHYVLVTPSFSCPMYKNCNRIKSSKLPLRVCNNVIH